MKERRMARFLAMAFAASGVLHGVAYASLGLAPRQNSTRLPVSSVVFEVHEAQRFETKPEPPKPVPSDEPKPAEPRAPSAPAPKPAPEPEPARTPVDLSGVTLTNADGAGDFAMPTGDGSDRRGPLGPLGPKPVESVRPAVASASEVVARAAPELVASKDLSERPQPPSLDGALRSLYPDEARRRAISGTASLRVRIGADGSVRAGDDDGRVISGFRKRLSEGSARFALDGASRPQRACSPDGGPLHVPLRR